jgi:hypothetical protein
VSDTTEGSDAQLLHRRAEFVIDGFVDSLIIRSYPLLLDAFGPKPSLQLWQAL